MDKYEMDAELPTAGEWAEWEKANPTRRLSPEMKAEATAKFQAMLAARAKRHEAAKAQ